MHKPTWVYIGACTFSVHVSLCIHAATCLLLTSIDLTSDHFYCSQHLVTAVKWFHPWYEVHDNIIKLL